VIRWYKVHCSAAAGGSRAAMVAIGSAMVIVYFFKVGVTGSMPGGILAHGLHSVLNTNSVGQLCGLQYLYHTWR